MHSHRYVSQHSLWGFLFMKPHPLMRWILRSASQRCLILLAAAAESRGNTFVLLLSGFTHLCIMNHFSNSSADLWSGDLAAVGTEMEHRDSRGTLQHTRHIPPPTPHRINQTLSLSLFIPTASPLSINTRPKIRLPQTWSFVWVGYVCHCKRISLIYTR